ncbi:MAG: HEAT repeat domain-containing protein [Haloarculaceae archaeon]
MSERAPRRERVAELGRLAETDPATLEDHVGDMTDYLDADSAYVRRRTTRAAAALASVRPAAAVPLVDGLTDRLADASDPDAAVALQRIAAEDPDAVVGHLAALVTVLDDEGPVVVPVSGALAALAGADAGALAQPGVLDRLFGLLDDDRPAVRRNAAVALAAIAEADPAAVCAGADDLPLDDDAPSVRRAAAVALGTAGSTCPDAVVEAAPALVALLDDADAGVRAGAAFALGHALRDAEVSQRTVDTLVGALGDDSADVRQHAAFALAALAADEPAAVRPGVDALARRLVDAAAPVRRNARSALDALEDDYPAVVSEAVEAVLTRLADVDGNTGQLGFTAAELRGLAGDAAAPAEQRATADHALSLVESGAVDAAADTESPVTPATGDDAGDDDDADAGTLFCPNCGESIDEGGEFCPVCGTAVE